MDGVAAVPDPLPQAEAEVVRVAAVATAAAGEDEDWGVFEVQELNYRGPSGRTAAAARRMSGGRTRPVAGGTQHAAITVPLPRAWQSVGNGKYQQWKQPPQLRAKGWRSWPLDKCIKVGEPTDTKPHNNKGPALFTSSMLSKEPDQMNFRAAPDPPLTRLDQIELSAKVADRRAQRAVVHATVGYFKNATISREYVEGLLVPINANLSAVFGSGVKWTTSQVPLPFWSFTRLPAPLQLCLLVLRRSSRGRLQSSISWATKRCSTSRSS